MRLLQVRRPSGSESDIGVVRSVQPYHSPVTHQIIAERNGDIVGSIKLSAFNARTRAEVADALRDLEADGAQRYVLDLRNNLGGLFLEGIEVARLFMDGALSIIQICQDAMKSLMIQALCSGGCWIGSSQCHAEMLMEPHSLMLASSQIVATVPDHYL